MPKVWIVFLLAAVIPLTATAKPYVSDPVLLKEFREACRQRQLSLPAAGLQTPLASGQIGFFPLGVMHPRQTRFSFTTYIKNLKKELKRSWGAGLLYDNGRAAHGLKSPALGVAYRGQIYISEGHHQILAALVRGASTAPVKILGDWSDLTREQFEARSRSLGLSYMQDAFGEASPPVEWCDLADDTNLELARLLTYKVQATWGEDGPKILSHEPSSLALKNRLRGGYTNEDLIPYPAALKLNGGTPFLEFIIADALTRAGVRYKGNLPTRHKVEKYLRILKKANKKTSPYTRLILVDAVMPAAELPLLKLIHEPLQQQTCTLALDPSAAIVP